MQILYVVSLQMNEGRVAMVVESWCEGLKGVYLVPLGGAAVFMNENVCRNRHRAEQRLQEGT